MTSFFHLVALALLKKKLLKARKEERAAWGVPADFNATTGHQCGGFQARLRTKQWRASQVNKELPRWFIGSSILVRSRQRASLVFHLFYLTAAMIAINWTLSIFLRCWRSCFWSSFSAKLLKLINKLNINPSNVVVALEGELWLPSSYHKCSFSCSKTYQYIFLQTQL